MFTTSVKTAISAANNEIRTLEDYKAELVRYHKDVIEYMVCTVKERR